MSAFVSVYWQSVIVTRDGQQQARKASILVEVCLFFLSLLPTAYPPIQGDHLSGKPGNVREFETCQGNVREKILSGRSVPKLFITS